MSKIRFNEDGTILLKDVRLSYPHLFEKWAKEGEEEKARYSAKFLLDKNTHADEIRQLKAHVVKLQQEWFKGKIGTDRLFFRDGADSGKEEMENCWVVSAGDSKRRPQVLNKDKSPVVADDDIVYGGCYVNALIRPWKQANQHGRRLNANLIGVQFVRDGERFGEQPIDASEYFDAEDGGNADFGGDEDEPF